MDRYVVIDPNGQMVGMFPDTPNGCDEAKEYAKRLSEFKNEPTIAVFGDDEHAGTPFKKNMAPTEQCKLFDADIRKFLNYLDTRYAGNPYFHVKSRFYDKLKQIKLEEARKEEAKRPSIPAELGKLASYAMRLHARGYLRRVSLKLNGDKWALSVYGSDESADGLEDMDYATAKSAINEIVLGDIYDCESTPKEKIPGCTYIQVDLRIYEPFSDDCTVCTVLSRPFSSEDEANEAKRSADKNMKAWVKENFMVDFDFDEVDFVSITRCPTE